MFEIERKFRLNPNEAAGLKVKLEAKYGAGKKIIQYDEHFLLNKSSYAEHATGDPVLRIRHANDKYFFTYKHTVKETGNRVEHETEIGNPEAMREALLAMGWCSVVRIEKVRWHFHASGVTYDLDTVKGLGHYLEVEIVSKEDSDAEATLVSIAEALDIPADRIERRSYGRLLQEESGA